MADFSAIERLHIHRGIYWAKKDATVASLAAAALVPIVD